jgi:hypothetical protein
MATEKVLIINKTTGELEEKEIIIPDGSSDDTYLINIILGENILIP